MIEGRVARVLLIGGTGMIGGHALELCLERPEVSSVTILVRRPTGLSHDKLVEVLHTDFADYSAAEEHLAGVDAALFCLGAYTGAVPDEEFRRITVDYTVAFANALHAKSPNAAVCFLSGAGADQTEQSRMAFARYKGAAEKALLGTGFARVHIFRPGYIYPVKPRSEPNFGYRVMRALYPIAGRIYSNAGIESDRLAGAMVDTALHGDPEQKIFENRDIRDMT